MQHNTTHTRISRDDVSLHQNTLADYHATMRDSLRIPGYSGSQDSLKLPTDYEHTSCVADIVKLYQTDQLQLIVVVGIGGSNLGTKAIYDALSHQVTVAKQILFLESIDVITLKYITNQIQHLSTDQYLINIVSKSGNTIETITNAELLVDALAVDDDQALRDRIVVTTDPSSDLYDTATRQGIATIAHPGVGGRFSVFSAVGLFPLGLAGIDTDALLSGAAVERDINLGPSDPIGPAAESAAHLYQHYCQGKTISNTFIFNTQLESCGKWYRQLIGESLGKKHTHNQGQTGRGIVPLISIGSTDLHSLSQLFLTDPGTLYTEFIRVDTDALAIPKHRLFGGIVPSLEGKNTTEINGALYQGITGAYIQKEIPFTQISLETLDAREVGSLLQHKMIEIMYLAHLMNINAFDQPAVEDYKIITRSLLG